MAVLLRLSTFSIKHEKHEYAVELTACPTRMYVEINLKFIDNMHIIYGVFNVIVFKSRVNAYRYAEGLSAANQFA